MDATLNEQEELLAETAARMAADMGIGDAAGPDAERGWARLREAGFPTMRLGGAGSAASTVEAAICAEAFGRVASPAPLVGPLIAAELLRLALDDEVAGEALVGGDRPLTVALTEALERLAAPGEVNGVAFDALGASGAVLADEGADGVAVYLTEVQAEPIAAADLSRAFRSVGGTARRIGESLDDATYARWRAFSLVVICADLVGAMAGALAMAVAYAAERQQFGRPIGSFQAIQHLCAEQHVSLEAARSSTYHAAWAADGQPADEALAAARVAKAYVAREGRQVGEAVLQIHGGIGHTWECDAHRFLRRILVDRAVLGDEHHQEQRLAEQLLAGTLAAGGGAKS